MQDGGKIQSFASLGLANRRAQQPAKNKQKKTNTEKTNTRKTKTKKINAKKDKHTKDKHKKDKHKKTNTQKTNTKKTNTKKRQTQETYKTYLGLIRLRVLGGEGRGSGKRKKFQIFQLKEQEHQKVIRGANQPIIGHVFKDLMIISKG